MEAAHKKLIHKDMDLSTIKVGDFDKARNLATRIQRRASELESEIYQSKKNFKRADQPGEMIRLSIEDDRLVLEATEDELAPRHDSQLAFWGFATESPENRFVSSAGSGRDLVEKVSGYFASCKFAVELDESARAAVAASVDANEALRAARQYGRAFKEGQHEPEGSQEFFAFLENSVPRRLKEHQRKAALHLIATGNAANLSVPGSGKTSVVLTVFQWLREVDLIDALFVVGPPACFGPWRTEYEETLGRSPAHEILAGGDVEERRAKYLVNRESVKDLYLTSFQTLQRDVNHVRLLFGQQDVRFFLVIDEAHYIKRIDGAWAVAALEVARLAERRCILTGTPFPRSFSDAFNLFDVLWPSAPRSHQSTGPGSQYSASKARSTKPLRS